VGTCAKEDIPDIRFGQIGYQVDRRSGKEGEGGDYDGVG
jgi:hypothetical protein